MSNAKTEAIANANAHLNNAGLPTYDDLICALELAEIRINSFYTATITNAKSREENREVKKQAVNEIRNTLANAATK